MGKAGRVVVVVVLLLVTSCRLTYYLNSKSYRNTDFNIWFRYPANWQEETFDNGIELKISEKEHVDFEFDKVYVPEPRMELGKRVAALKEKLEKEGASILGEEYEYLDNVLAYTLKATTKEGEYREITVFFDKVGGLGGAVILFASSPNSPSVRNFRYLKNSIVFLTQDPIFADLKLFNVRLHTLPATMLVVVIVLIIIGLGKDFFVDLYRFFVQPRMMAREFAKQSSMTWYSVFLTLIGGCLLTLTYYVNQTKIIREITERVSAGADYVVKTQVPADVYSSKVLEMLKIDVYSKVMYVWKVGLEYLILLPILLMVIWAVYGLGVFLGGLMLKSRASVGEVIRGTSILFFFKGLASLTLITGYLQNNYFLLVLGIVFGIYTLVYLVVTAEESTDLVDFGKALVCILMGFILLALIFGGTAYYFVNKYIPEYNNLFNVNQTLLQEGL